MEPLSHETVKLIVDLYTNVHRKNTNSVIWNPERSILIYSQLQQRIKKKSKSKKKKDPNLSNVSNVSTDAEASLLDESRVLNDTEPGKRDLQEGDILKDGAAPKPNPGTSYGTENDLMNFNEDGLESLSAVQVCAASAMCDYMVCPS